MRGIGWGLVYEPELENDWSNLSSPIKIRMLAYSSCSSVTQESVFNCRLVKWGGIVSIFREYFLNFYEGEFFDVGPKEVLTHYSLKIYESEGFEAFILQKQTRSIPDQSWSYLDWNLLWNLLTWTVFVVPYMGHSGAVKSSLTTISSCSRPRQRRKSPWNTIRN